MERRANLIVGVLLAVVLVVALAFVVGARLPGSGDYGELHALVHDSDGRTYELPLSQDTTITVDTDLGTNVVVVKDGAVSVADADCDNHDCMRQGTLDAPGKQIICLPHELWIEVVSSRSQSNAMDTSAVAGTPEDLDAVSR